jgi:phenylpropionate dioxygenase-like ring-hydroxylating dioxygenase large terminal subunit/AcrR family transcriptional regulator
MSVVADRPVQSRLSQDVRREQLIAAAIGAIAEHGLSNVTLHRVANAAGLTAGMVNFHFDSKQALLLATLRHVAEEFRSACDAGLAEAGADPAAALMALVETSFDADLASTDKLAVWYAFWGESQARSDYIAVCGGSDRAFRDAVQERIAALAKDSRIDTKAATLGLSGVIDALCQQALIEGPGFDRLAAIETCRRYLANLFPDAFRAKPARPAVTTGRAPVPTLPGWTYASAEIHAREIGEIHLPAWQLVCHISEIPNVGDFSTFDGLGQRAFVIRGEDGTIRAFHNACRHRAHAVVDGVAGNCKGMIRCAYHNWTYRLDGELRAIASPRTFAEVDPKDWGLRRLDCEVFLGFVFLRFKGGGPSVADRYAPHRATLEAHRFEEMVPLNEGGVSDEVEADWKNVWDNYLEDYHFPTGHPGLSGLMSADYERAADQATRTIRLSHALRDQVVPHWSIANYARLLPEIDHLPEADRRRWSYFFLYPSFAFDVYPEMMDFMQVIPTGPGRCKVRWRAYGLPCESREMRATRWLNQRINLQVHAEDVALIRSVQKGLSGGGYGEGMLNTKEVCLRAFQGWVRDDLGL